MVYRNIIRTPQQWLIGDRADISGTITVDNGQPVLLGATVRLNRTYIEDDLMTETSASLPDPGSGQFSVNVGFDFFRQDNGTILVRALPDTGIRATLDAGISDTDPSVDITATSGIIPASGWALINSEWTTFTYSAPTITFTERGSFNTAAAAHLSGDTLSFSIVRETCTPYFPFKVLRKDAID